MARRKKVNGFLNLALACLWGFAKENPKHSKLIAEVMEEVLSLNSLKGVKKNG